MNSPFEENLPKNQANYSPLTPLSFLTRTAEVFPERTAVIHGEIKRSWRETLKRCTRLASELKKKRSGSGNYGFGDGAQRSGVA